MILLAFDTENTGAQVDHAKSSNPNNVCCLMSFVLFDTNSNKTETHSFDIDYTRDSWNFSGVIDRIKELVSSADWIVLFNAKYDINWAYRYGITFDGKNIWDCSLYHNIANGQVPYPSLNSVAEHYGLGTKLDVVSTEYWDKGLDTDAVPWEILVEYCEMDVHLTLEICKRQMREFKTLSRKLKVTIRTAMADILGLATMERNGFKLNLSKIDGRKDQCSARINEIAENLVKKYFNIPDNVPFNMNSVQQLSVVLFGGTLTYFEKEPYEFYYKDPKKAPTTKLRLVERSIQFDPLFVPIRGTQLKDKRFYKTDVKHLKSLKTRTKFQRNIIDLLLEYSKLEKMLSTYYIGLPAKMEQSSWGEFIHTDLSQVTVATGRLASSKPNLQNIAGSMKDLFISRFTHNANC